MGFLTELSGTSAVSNLSICKMKLIRQNPVLKKGFSLAELLAALVISSMVILAVFSLYTRLNKVSAAVISRLDRGRLPREILQLIAEDLDRIISDTKDTKVNFQNKIERNGLQSARMEIIKSIYDKEDKPVTFEQIIWQTSVDLPLLLSSDRKMQGPKGMVLYRRHSGIALEDKLLDEPRQNFEKDLFIPVCGGVTFFSIRTGNFQSGSIQTETDGQPALVDRWSADSLPANIIVAISFADPVEVSPGQWQVPDTEKITRIIALDRTRKIPFTIEMKDFNEVTDQNKPSKNTKVNIQDQNKTGGNVRGK
jgi:prepilin-type N-terminal cleavage/methylation domain-containing protein